ncbi:Fe-S cluster assembly protein SufD [soil metagenome]
MASETFTTDVAQRLGGPDWLRDRRVAAAVLGADTPAPTTESEEWRYSRIGDLELDRYSLLEPDTEPVGPVPDAAVALLGELGAVAGAVVVHNGRIISTVLDERLRDSGVPFGAAGSGPEGVLGAAMPSPHDLFAVYNDAFGADPVVLDVPRNLVVNLPFAVITYADADGSFTLPRLSVRAGENSQFSFVEVSSSAAVEALVAPVTEVTVGNAARVRHSSLQDVGPKVWHIGSFVAEVGQDATLDAAVAALGGSYARTRLDCRLVGRGATGNLSSVYFGDHDQMLDLRTFQEHRAPDTTSNLLFKGAVADHSHSVYTGLIRIKPEGRGSNAVQTNRNLKLSDHAWAESVPNLEIENNDVHCAHASTVGPVDEEQRFYVESRGVPSIVAERLIVAGFFDEVLDSLAVPALAPAARRRVNALLDRQVGVLTAHVSDRA